MVCYGCCDSRTWIVQKVLSDEAVERLSKAFIELYIHLYRVVLMAKEKKIKVEAEVTTKKNVSSGIGKGFGITIGIFLALLVIAISCSILISSKADNLKP